MEQENVTIRLNAPARGRGEGLSPAGSGVGGRQPPRRWLPAHPARAVLLLLALLLIGCGGPGTEADPNNNAPLPRLAELEPATPVFEAPPQPELAAAAAGGPRLLVQRLAFSRDDYRVDLALRFAEQTLLTGEVAERWQANGLHLAALPREKAALLAANLPIPMATDALLLRPTENWQPFELVGRVAGRQEVRVKLPDDQPPASNGYDLEVFRGGEHRLLLKIDAEDAERPLHILPQHYKPYDALLPRMPQEKVLDGQVFDSLQVTHAPPRDRVWLVWGDAPPPSSGIANLPLASREEKLALLPTLGQVMFAGAHRDGPVRLVVVIAPSLE